ncbi:hypothetical protein GCM10009801_45590 [Streptomyces albiaxialis]|uniref:TIGR04222 domain-containing membrane protein n=1 Tax=Streptomyces albiaxialis TaxID=329523 RepID=A0ABN2W746_9ACTN
MSQQRMIFQSAAALVLAAAALALFGTSVHSVFTGNGVLGLATGLALLCLIVAFHLARGVARRRGWIKDTGRDSDGDAWVSGGGSGGGGGMSCGGGCGGGSGGS